MDKKNKINQNITNREKYNDNNQFLQNVNYMQK